MARALPSSLLALLVLLPAVLAAGCGTRSPAEPGGPLIVSPIQVDSVEVRVAAESAPPQVFARVTGVVGDGCARLLPIRQQRSGALVRVQIDRERPRDAVCIQIAQLFDETIRLEGEFPPGAYTLQVNDVARAFSVP